MADTRWPPMQLPIAFTALYQFEWRYACPVIASWACYRIIGLAIQPSFIDQSLNSYLKGQAYCFIKSFYCLVYFSQNHMYFYLYFVFISFIHLIMMQWIKLFIISALHIYWTHQSWSQNFGALGFDLIDLLSLYILYYFWHSLALIYPFVGKSCLRTYFFLEYCKYIK